MTPQKNQAIETALTGNWQEAVTLNVELLKADPNDIETLNRLAYAYNVLGKAKEAKETYRRVLALDEQNPIALKNLKRMTQVGKLGLGAPSPNIRSVDSLFLEESGKTKVIELVNVAQPNIISNLMAGEPLELRIKRLKIFAIKGKEYIGMLPDDIGRRLIKFLNGGNDYEACVKSVESRKVTVFIKESKRAAKFKNQPSFVSTEKGKSYARLKRVEIGDTEIEEDQEEE